MNVLLALVLFTQVSYFEFGSVASPQVAGDSFAITVIARKANGELADSFNGPTVLTTNRDGFYRYVNPFLINFANGVSLSRVQITLASDSIAIKCTEPNSGATGWTNYFDVGPNSASRLATILPGETLAPGSPGGRIRNPSSHFAGDTFLVNTYMTDEWFNPTGTGNDSVAFTSTDVFMQGQRLGQLQNGFGQFWFSLRRAGLHYLYTRSLTSQSIRADTSSQFAVIAGPFSNLLLLLPGEALLPGDDEASLFATPGKSGRPAVQYVKDTFPVKVIGTDQCWNQVSTPQDVISLKSDFAFSANPASRTMTDSALFQAEFDSAGANQTLWAHDQSRTLESYPCFVDVQQRCTEILIQGRDTIRAGEVEPYTGIFLDANGSPIPAKNCRFRVTYGHGAVSDSVGITDSAGAATVQFSNENAHFEEYDTIEFSADGFAKRKGIFVSLPDTTIVHGSIVAYPNPFGWDSPSTTILYYVIRQCNVTQTIYDPFGNLVWKIEIPAGEEGARAGWNVTSWNGTNMLGAKVASGLYVLKVWGTMHTGIEFKKTYRIGVVW